MIGEALDVASPLPINGGVEDAQVIALPTPIQSIHLAAPTSKKPSRRMVGLDVERGLGRFRRAGLQVLQGHFP